MMKFLFSRRARLLGVYSALAVLGGGVAASPALAGNKFAAATTAIAAAPTTGSSAANCRSLRIGKRHLKGRPASRVAFYRSDPADLRHSHTMLRPYAFSFLYLSRIEPAHLNSGVARHENHVVRDS